MIFRVYLRNHGGGSISPETKTTTADPRAAEAAYRALLARDDLIGQPTAAVLSSAIPGSGGGASIYFSRFDREIGDGRIHPDAPLDLLRTNDGTQEATRWPPPPQEQQQQYNSAGLKRAGLNGKRAAEILGVSELTISRSLNGHTPPHGGLQLLLYLWPRLSEADRDALLRGDHRAIEGTVDEK